MRAIREHVGANARTEARAEGRYAKMKLGKILLVASSLTGAGWLAAGTGCVVETETTGTGGMGGMGGAATTDAGVGGNAVTTGGGMGGAMGTGGAGGSACQEVADCKKCSACAQGCGVVETAKASVCNCNDAGNGKASIDLYTDVLDCICGADGMSGKCGTKCSKTCLGTGMDASDCQQCLGAAVGTTCKDAFGACAADM